MQYKQATLHISDQHMALHFHVSTVSIHHHRANSMIAVPYQCFVLSIVYNFVIHILFLFLYLIQCSLTCGLLCHSIWISHLWCVRICSWMYSWLQLPVRCIVLCKWHQSHLLIIGLAGPASTSSSHDEDSLPPTLPLATDDYMDESTPSSSSARRARKRRTIASLPTPRQVQNGVDGNNLYASRVL